MRAMSSSFPPSLRTSPHASGRYPTSLEVSTRVYCMDVCVWLLVASTNFSFPSSPFSSFPSTPLSLPLPPYPPSLFLSLPTLPPSLLSAEKKTAVGVVQGNIDEAGELVSNEISRISTPSLLTPLLLHPLTSSPPYSWSRWMWRSMTCRCQSGHN